MNYLCISDFDGTLIKKDKSISNYTKEIIDLFTKTNNLIIISNSSFDELKSFKNKYNLNIDLFSISDLKLLINNEEKNYIIEAKKINILITLFKDYIYTAYNDKIVYNFQERLINIYPKNYKLDYKFDDSSFINIAIDINKKDDFICFLGANDMSYDVIGEDKNRAFYNIKMINKSKAFDLILSYYENKKTIGFSDSYSDFNIINKCDIKVAMENADDYLKNSVDYITSSNDNDGVALFLNNICHLK